MCIAKRIVLGSFVFHHFSKYSIFQIHHPPTYSSGLAPNTFWQSFKSKHTFKGWKITDNILLNVQGLSKRLIKPPRGCGQDARAPLASMVLVMQGLFKVNEDPLSPVHTHTHTHTLWPFEQGKVIVSYSRNKEKGWGGTFKVSSLRGGYLTLLFTLQYIL